MFCHASGTGLDGIDGAIELQEAFRRPIHRPPALFIPAVETGAGAESGNRLLVAPQSSVGVAQIVEPAWVVRMFLGVTRQNRDISLRFLPVLLLRLPQFVEADALQRLRCATL